MLNTDQVRTMTLEGGRLTIKTPPIKNPVSGDFRHWCSSEPDDGGTSAAPHSRRRQPHLKPAAGCVPQVRSCHAASCAHERLDRECAAL
jgi:hypothetical protein